MTPAPSRSTPHPRASLQETRAATKLRAKPSIDGRSRIRQENGNIGTDIYDSTHVAQQGNE